VGFFEPLPPPPALPEQPPQPEWVGPPDNVLGRPVPVDLVVARTEDAAVVVRNVVAYPNGVAFVLDVRRRKADPWDDPLGMHPRFGGTPETQKDILRFGVGLSDGSKATTGGHFPWGDRVQGPLLTQGGGGGGGTRWAMSYWLWPLPPQGPLTFVAEWRAQGIQETRVEIDAGVLREAAARAEKLWDENPTPAGGGFTTMSEIGFSTAQVEPRESD
jgi:hypothetical protein